MDADLGCTACHGGAAAPSTPVYSEDVRIAPPSDLAGNSDPTSRGVGAHRSHLVEGDFRTNLECSDCHIRPDSVDDTGHIDTDLVAEINFGELAAEEDANPVWDSSMGSCSGTYCHGTTKEGGGLTEPLWMIVDGSQAFCGSCHGIPPHDDFGSCNFCHGNVVTADTTITDLGKTLHINGEIDF
jgi:predicted CxxxxCH...CXXCH cytochrome family protein